MTNVLRSKIEKRLRKCKGIGSQKGRGAKPPDLWGPGAAEMLQNGPKQTSRKSRLSAETLHFLIPWRPVLQAGLETGATGHALLTPRRPESVLGVVQWTHHA